MSKLTRVRTVMGSGKGERQKGVGGSYKLGKAASLESNRERLIGTGEEAVGPICY